MELLLDVWVKFIYKILHSGVHSGSMTVPLYTAGGRLFVKIRDADFARSRFGARQNLSIFPY